MTVKQMNLAQTAEIEKFNQIAHQWWDVSSSFKPLHAINPLRTDWIAQQSALSGRRVLDLGCGGGLLSESLARKQALVCGVDPSPRAIEVATLHALESQLTIDYFCGDLDAYQTKNPNAQFDVICCMEMLEHVPDPAQLVQALNPLLVPGGWLFLSTLNRNARSFLGAIVMAEHILSWLPKGTHDWEQFIQPAELARWVRQAGLNVVVLKGIEYYPFTQTYALSDSVAINYMMSCRKPL